MAARTTELNNFQSR